MTEVEVVSQIPPTVKDSIQILAWGAAAFAAVFGVVRGFNELKRNRGHSEGAAILG